MHGFLSSDSLDPPPFNSIDGDWRAGLLLVCDHASAVIPAAMAELGLTGAARFSHVAWDPGAAEVTRYLAAHFRCPAVLGGVSRLVVDCNRRPDDSSAIPAVSCDVPVPGNQDLDEAAVAARIDRWFVPYHRAIAARLAEAASCAVRPAVVAIHSFTPCMAGFDRPWHVGVLWNADDRLAAPLLRFFAGNGDWVVGDNQPYSGRQMNYTLDTHAGASALPHVSVEIRQDLLADAEGCRRWGAILAEALEPVLAEGSGGLR